MESPLSVESPFKTSSIVAELNKHNNSTTAGNENRIIGSLEVYVHQAWDIQNICIYHKQDVYAKLYLTSNPEKTVSTKVINGGGRNPVFDDKLLLGVQTVDCYLKCEIYMMSRVKNYLEDQLLGFTLVPLNELLVGNGKLAKDYSLSSTDLFHSPAGYVQLSFKYTGTSPDVMVIPAISSNVVTAKEPEGIETITGDMDKIEFPDLKTLNDNLMMLSEYFGIPCLESIDSERSESWETSDAVENEMSFRTRDPEMLFFNVSDESPKRVSSDSSVSTLGISSPVLAVSSDSSNVQVLINKLPNQENISDSELKRNSADVKTESPCEAVESLVKPVLPVNIKPEQNVVQQDIVDMYMKSMQQFTESLANMKLPLNISSPTRSENSNSSDQKLQTPKNDGSRVFYGSRAFF